MAGYYCAKCEKFGYIAKQQIYTIDDRKYVKYVCPVCGEEVEQELDEDFEST